MFDRDQLSVDFDGVGDELFHQPFVLDFRHSWSPFGRVLRELERAGGDFPLNPVNQIHACLCTRCDVIREVAVAGLKSAEIAGFGFEAGEGCGEVVQAVDQDVDNFASPFETAVGQ